MVGDGWETLEEGDCGVACQGWSPPAVEWGHQQFRRGSKYQLNSWCWALPVTILSQGGKCRSPTSPPVYSFYLWPGLAVLGFPILLPSSREELHPFHSSFCGLSALVREFHREDRQTGKHYEACRISHLHHLHSPQAEETSTVRGGLSLFSWAHFILLT